MPTPTSLDPEHGAATRPTSATAHSMAEDHDLTKLVARHVEEMAAAWDRGERPRAEEFLARHPGLRDEDAVRLVFEEACLRQEAGEEAVTAEIFRRFPQWRAQLGLLLDCNRVLRTPPHIDFPKVGEELGDFRLLVEIGRGAMGRTFLASQHSLADRPIVLKITSLGREEHLSLARLQHMHIVPLYFEQVFPERNLRVLGMPYLGGTSLDRVLDVVTTVPVARRTGSLILDAVDRCTRALSTEYPASGPFRKYLAQESYVRAICWLGACLADALQYAHDRGLVHFDIKPSNVLIAGDGQPMLLDFHLARGPVSQGDPVPERLGGTPGYLSPEQQSAMDAVRRGGVVTCSIDGRSDIYSLGLLLCEALNGTSTSSIAKVLRIPAGCGGSSGLSDIIRKCLATDPDERYPNAASVALDLRRHLNDLPLRGVPNRSPVERWHKWRRRDPGGLGRAVVKVVTVLAVLAILAISVSQLRQRDSEIDAALTDGRRHLRRHQYSEASLALQRGLKLASSLPGHRSQKLALTSNLRRVQWAKAVDELHAVVEMLRFRFGVAPPEFHEAKGLFQRGLAVWNSRRRFTNSGDDPRDSRTEQQVRDDLVDLATILADLGIHQPDRADAKSALEGAVRILSDAETEFGPSPALSRDLRAYAKQAGRTDIPPRAVPAPRTAWEHYDLGRSYLRSGEYSLAEKQLRRSVELEPGKFWPQYYLGISAYRLERYQDAVAAFGTCIALAPQTAECYYNRGLAYAALSQIDRAILDDSRALELDPRLTDAALNRGSLQFQAGKLSEALADFERAGATATSSTTLRLVQYNMGLVHIARKDWPAAKGCLKQASDAGLAEAGRLYKSIENR